MGYVLVSERKEGAALKWVEGKARRYVPRMDGWSRSGRLNACSIRAPRSGSVGRYLERDTLVSPVQSEGDE